MTGTRWSAWLARQAREREDAGLTRRLAPRRADDDVLDLAGNDYLGLSRHPEIVAAAVAAARTWGAGAGASRLVTGSTSLHTELEAELADFLGRPAALTLSTGYHANLAAVAALADRDALIVSDAHVHASLVDAARLSRAEVRVVPHGDVAAVDAALDAGGDRRAIVLVESVFSVLGDAAPLADLTAVTERRGALLLVDEAHGLGVAGAGGHGLLREAGLSRAEHVVVTATLSKALGSQGGAVLASPAVVEQLVNRARPFIYDTGLAPPAAAAALAAVRHLRAHPELATVVTRRTAELAAALGEQPTSGAVLSVPMPSPYAALDAQAACLAEGVRVGCFRPPSTPDAVSRLRVTASAGLSEPDWARATDVVARAVKDHR
ncbi:MAG: 8-amino-7-oxononanoate synthase [Nocardioidaceae bacterium]